MSGIKHRKHAFGRSGRGPVALSTLMTGIALGLPSLAPAATPAVDAPAIPTQLPAVTVTAQRDPYKIDQMRSPKFTQPLLDTPQTINVISGEVIQQQGATTLTEALQNSPGIGTFFVGENGTTSTGDAVFLRGFDASGSIFIDGVRDLGAISRDVFDTEQVEVTKGPDGVEYGRTTPAGAINMVTKQPMLTDHVSGSLAYGSSNQKRATADWNQVLGKDAAFRLNVMGQKSGVPGRDDVRNDRWGVAPALAFGLGTATSVAIDYLHISQSNVPDGGVPTIGLPGYATPDPTRPFVSAAAPVGPSNFYGTAADYDHVKADMFTVIAEHDFNDAVALHDTFRWDRTFQDYMLTATQANAANLVTPNPLDPPTWTLARSLPTFRDQTNRILTNQTNLTAHFTTGTITHDFSAGIELTREQIATDGIGAVDGSTWTPANLYHPDPAAATGLVIGDTGAWSRGRTDTAAAYVFDTLHFGERWLVTTGARVDHYRTDFRSVLPCGPKAYRQPLCGRQPPGTPLTWVDAGKTGNPVSYQLGVIYKPAANGSVYANFATGVEPPGGNQLSFSGSAGSGDNPIFDPEQMRSTELGTKWNVLGDKLRLTAALYRTVATNLVVQDPVDLQYQQIGRQRVQGVEFDAVGQVTRNWSLTAGYVVMNTRVQGATLTQSGSDALPYTPTRAFTAWSTWRLPHGFMLGGGARYYGKMQGGKGGGIGTPAYTQAYWVFDAVAGYAINRHANLQLNVYNLFDRHYVAAINMSGYRYTPGAPRSALLTLNVDF